MAPDLPLLRIFLSSPSDVAAERQMAREIIEALNDNTFIKGTVRIEPLAWEDPGSRVLMPISLTPQQAINRGMARPSETEAVIVILWGRMGTPLDTDKHGTKENGEPYWSGTEWEFLEARAGAAKHARNLPIILVYRRMDTPPQPDGDDLEGIEKWLTQRKRVKAFFEQFRDPETDAYRANINEYHSPAEFRTMFAKDAELLAKELIALRQNAPPPRAAADDDQMRIAWEGSPFPGLRAFTEKDEPIFFGRGYETADLIKRLSKQRLMFVVGASGSGKSSLVGAGVLPHIKRGAVYGVAGWHIVRFTPGDAPFLRLSRALLQSIPALDDPIADDEERAKQLTAVLRKSPDKLAQQIEKWLSKEADGTEVLLFVDQFEELFTTTPRDQQAAFAAMLQRVSPQIRIIATMRSDFYDRALIHFESVLRDATYTLGTPSPIALYEMMTRPAQVTGLQFDDGLAEEIVDKTTGQVGGLALVAYLLEELYLRTASHGDGKLTRDDYDDLGGVERAIATRAATIYRDEVDLPDERKKAALQRVFHELVEPTIREGEVVATRGRVAYTRFSNDEDARYLIDAFTKARLLVRDAGMVEVAHEALLREWGELSAWIISIADDLRLLRQYERDANDWEKRGADPDEQPRAEQLRPFFAALESFGYTWEGLHQPLRKYSEPEQNRKLRELEALPPTPDVEGTRRDIGDRLAVIGDPRPGVGVVDGVPDMLWLPVTGSGGEFEFKDDRGKTFGSFAVPHFFIARYLTTYVQYQAFVDAEDGYQNLDWWQDMPEGYQPQDLKEQRTKSPNNPRDSISWYQAVAFSRWLNSKLQGVALEHPSGILTIGDNAEVRLPTEWEWQWVAQNGTEKREYPWGERKSGYANTNESGLGRAIAVGMYPHGAVECGALDMSGNLYEWVLSKHKNPEQVQVDASGSSRVLRGGAFGDLMYSAASGYRPADPPGRGSLDFGCRVVVSAPFPQRA